MKPYDLIVIGSGPGGQKAALTAAKAGFRAVLVELGADLGGGCVHSGTLPSKSFRESVYRWSMSSKGYIGQENSDATGVCELTPSPLDVQPEMERLLERRNRVVMLEAQVVREQMERNGVEVIGGRGRLLSPKQVEVTTLSGEKRVLEGRRILIAVGASPIAPEHLRCSDDRVFDSDHLLNMKSVPKRMVVLGGGVIGFEYATMFQMAGTEVTLVDRRSDVLSWVDREMVQQLLDRSTHYGLNLELDTEAEAVLCEPNQVRVPLKNGKTLVTDVVLIAMGRQGNTSDLGLENVGLKADSRGLLSVNASFQTEVPSIYAVGDVVGYPALAATAFEQGRVAACHALKLKNRISDVHRMSEIFPYGIYTIPEISMIGETEEQLKERGADFVVGKARYREVARGLITGDRWGLLKILVDRKTLKILGVHIIGDNAADLIHIGQAVMTLQGDVRYFVQSVFNYPTLAEAYKLAAFQAVNQI